MIRGIGIDVVQVSRIRHWLTDEGLLRRYFHSEEVEASRRRGDSAALSLAARFAAKEAFGKALGTGLRHFRLYEVQVQNDELGKPNIVLHGNAQDALEHASGSRVLCSLTHEQDNAIAMIVIEGE